MVKFVQFSALSLQAQRIQAYKTGIFERFGRAPFHAQKRAFLSLGRKAAQTQSSEIGPSSLSKARVEHHAS